MSHIVTINTKIRDPLSLVAACLRLGLPPPIQGTAQLYSGQASGWVVRLPDWRYPAVIDTASGEIAFDHFEGQWGDPKYLDKLLQAYAVEKTMLEARRAGHVVTERPLADGSIRLTIAVEGGAA